MTASQEFPEHFVVWNVGQGLWTTAVTDQACWHFDMGGERGPWTKIMLRCRGRENKVHLSHWDSDHINFVSRGRNLLPNLCRLNWPALEASQKKKAHMKRVPVCSQPIPFQTWSPLAARTTNEASAVAKWHQVLIPGDSNKGAEKFWIDQLSGIAATRVLVLGHHGSRTSTSRELLKRMPNLAITVASARRARYGHPHREVLDLLQKFGVPVLSTEDWGNIFIW
jgi:competence protein ComEC